MKSSKLFLSVALPMMLCVLQFVNASPGLDITLIIDRSPPQYMLAEIVEVQGNLTWDGSLVPDGLVALQIDDPDEGYFILRTLSTGTPPAAGGVIEILEVIPCDSQGNPQQIFTRDAYAHFSVTLRNNDEDPMYVLMCVNLFDAKMVPLHASIQHAGLMEPGEFSLLFPCMIPEEAALGNATIHISAFNALPTNQGAQAYPYCPEKSAEFTIESPIGAAPSTSYPVGTYGLTFKLPWTGKLGSYSIYASSNYEGEGISSSINFIAIPGSPLQGDVNWDGIVDIYDAILLGLAFGSSPGEPGWNVRCDFNTDDIIDIYDAIILGNNFGKTV
ncbi:MAG: hypothetical protein O2V44_06265 [Candidatus Bathyarchaeota archaeon]|nr:hypothetical protein [Candidatus Bathyarchaeota archaeon]